MKPKLALEFLPDQSRNYWPKLVMVAVIYVLAAKFGLSLAYSTKQVTTIWPPTGIALAALLLLGYRYWPAIFVGAFIANFFTREPMLVALFIAIGNTLEAVVGVYLLQRTSFRWQLDRTRDVLALVLLASVASTAVSAFIGTTTLAAGHLIGWQHYWSVWLIWWVGDAMGSLIFAPLILTYWNADERRLWRRRLVESGFLVALTFAASAVVFLNGRMSPTPITYIVLPFIVWGALRLGRLGAVTTTLVLAMTAAFSTINSLGPFAAGGVVEHDLILLESFITVVAITGLLLAATVAERNSVQQILLQKASELEASHEALEDAHQRITDILAGILEQDNAKRHAGNRRQS